MPRSTYLTVAQDSLIYKFPCLLKLPPITLEWSCLFLQSFLALHVWGHFAKQHPHQCGRASPNLLKVKVLDAQSCLTLCDPMDCSLPGSAVLGVLQARILEWVWSGLPFTSPGGLLDQGLRAWIKQKGKGQANLLLCLSWASILSCPGTLVLSALGPLSLDPDHWPLVLRPLGFDQNYTPLAFLRLHYHLSQCLIINLFLCIYMNPLGSVSLHDSG